MERAIYYTPDEPGKLQCPRETGQAAAALALSVGSIGYSLPYYHAAGRRCGCTGKARRSVRKRQALCDWLVTWARWRYGD